jgi:hypothetical protein
MDGSFPTRSVAESLGFPPEYFSIRSLANGKLWDIHGNFDDDGTLVYLWREKEKSLVESAMRLLILCPSPFLLDAYAIRLKRF